MAFVPVPVEQDKRDAHAAEVRRAGFRLMDEFLKTNEGDEASMAAFMSLVLDRVCANILAHPEDDKYRRLRVRSKALAPVGSVKLGQRVLDYLGFRSRVEEMEQWLVLLTADERWPEELQRKADVIRSEWNKHVAAGLAEARGASRKADAERKHKEQVLARINQERAERNAKKS